MSLPTDKKGAKPAYLKGLLWFGFGGMAMLSAFILPVHLWALWEGATFNLSHFLLRLYFFVLFIAALYHGLYRTETIVFDLGLKKIHKTVGYLCIAFFLFFSALTFYLFFGDLFL